MGGTNSPGTGGTRRIATGIDTVEGSSKSESTSEVGSEVEARDLLELDVRTDMTEMDVVQGDRSSLDRMHLPSGST